MQLEKNDANYKTESKRLCIIIGSHDLVDELSAIIKGVIEDKYELKILNAHYLYELLKLALENKFDIFIPVMDCIWDIGNSNADEQIQFIKYFRAKYNEPIIALSRYYYPLSFAEQLKQAGANYAFTPMPNYEFTQPQLKKDMEEAIKGCLGILNRENDLIPNDELSYSCKKNILVVDFDKGSRESLRMILKSRYNVSTAEDAREALRKIREAIIPYDLITTDVRMPGIDGSELVRQIRKSNIDTPVIIASGHLGRKISSEMISEGLISDYIEKPYGFREVQRKVARLLNGSNGIVQE